MKFTIRPLYRQVRHVHLHQAPPSTQMKPFQVNTLRRSRSALMAGLICMTVGVHAEDPMDLSHRNLFALCTPMSLIVEPIREDQSRKIGLTGEAVENEIESRLRAAHLYQADASQYLSADVNLSDSGDFFGPSLSLNRYVNDMGFGVGGFVTVWNASSTGTHGGDGKHVLRVVTVLLDEFLASYLRVNERECAQK